MPRNDDRKPRSQKASVSNRSARASRRASSRTSGQSVDDYRAIPGGKYRAARSLDFGDEYATTRVGDMRRADRMDRARSSSRRYLVRAIAAIALVVVVLAGWAALYNSAAFSITNVTVEGVEHLTSDEMAQLANVPADSTLLRVDTDIVRNRILQNAWVDDVVIDRVFPDTLKISVTERTVSAVVEVPNRAGSAVKSWLIADDHVWLMPVPDADSEAAKTTSARIYEDAERVLHITDVPYGTEAEIGQACIDGNVNNALDIVSGMTTELADRVVRVSAAGTAETTLLLDNGVEIAFGRAENIRDKERVILQILEDNPDSVAYINVRMVENPTWRAI